MQDQKKKKKEISILSRTSQASSKVTCLTNLTLNNTGALKLLCKVWGSNQHSLMCIPICVLTNGGVLTLGKELTCREPWLSHWSTGRSCTNFTAEQHIQESLQNPGSWALGPSAPFSPHVPSMGLVTLPLSGLYHTCAPLCHYCLSLPSAAPPLMTALWPEPRLPSIFNTKCFISINQSTQIKSKHWEIPRLKNKGKHLLKCCLFFKLQFTS